FTAAAKIDANAGIAVACQIRMSQRVPLIRAVALAIGKIFEDCRNGILLGVLWQPDASRQHRTVFKRYQRVLDYPHSLWKARNNHGGLLTMATVLHRAPVSKEANRRARDVTRRAC